MISQISYLELCRWAYMQTSEARGPLKLREESTIYMTFSSQYSLNSGQLLTKATEPCLVLFPQVNQAVCPDTGKGV